MSEKMNKLKEIAGENVLDTEMLDQIAGGNSTQLSVDTQFFNQLGLYSRVIPKDDLDDNETLYRATLDDVALLYSKYGVVYTCPGKDIYNSYLINGKRVSQLDAMKHVNARIAKSKKKGGK